MSEYRCSDGFCGALDCSRCHGSNAQIEVKECEICGGDLEELYQRDQCPECYIDTLEDELHEEKCKFSFCTAYVFGQGNLPFASLDELVKESIDRFKQSSFFDKVKT